MTFLFMFLQGLKATVVSNQQLTYRMRHESIQYEFSIILTCMQTKPRLTFHVSPGKMIMLNNVLCCVASCALKC